MVEPGQPPPVALMKCDVVDSTRLAAEAMSLVHDAVEFAASAYGVGAGYPRWEGDGASACFTGPDAAPSAVRAALDAVERVRLIPGHEVRLRASVGAGEAAAGADLTKVSPPDFNLAGHMVGGAVCPPSAVCLTEDVYFQLLHACPDDLAKRFAYLGTTTRDGAPVFASPPGKRRAKPGGLRGAGSDAYPAALALRAHYPRPPFSVLRFYALPQFNFVGALDLMSVFTPLAVRRNRASGMSLPEPMPDEMPERPIGLLSRLYGGPAGPFSEAFRRHRSLILLGDPGSGKSTLLRYLAVVAAGGRSVTRQRLGVGERLLPVHTTAAALIEERRRHPDQPLSAVLAHLLAPQIAAPHELLGRAIAEAADPGEALFLVDGLDEIPEAADRLQAAQIVEGLAQQYPRSRFVVTSRIVGYPGVILPGSEEYVLEPLEPEQTRSLARAFYVELFKSQKYDQAAALREGTAKGDRLVEALEERESLALFARNPLLLSLAALVHVQLGELPRYRVKLYDVATQTLVEAWAKARRAAGGAGGAAGPVRAVDYATEGRAVLPSLALHMHEHCPGGVIAERELLAFVAGRLPRGAAATDPLLDEQRARDFLARLRDAGSLLVERGAEKWGFMHQTFQEYLAAKALAAQDRHDELLDSRARLYAVRWEEVVQFTAGELGVVQGRALAAGKFIASILADARDWRATDLKRNVLLAAGCAADTVYEPPTLEGDIVSAVKGVLDRVGPPWWAVEKTLRHLRSTPLALLLVDGSAKWPRREAALVALGRRDLAIAPLLETLREDKDEGARAGAAAALANLGAREAIADLQGTLREDKDEGARAAAAFALGKLGAREAIADLQRTLREGKGEGARGAAAFALGKLGAREATADLQGTLREDKGEGARRGAAFALGLLGAREAIADLQRTLREDKGEDARAAAAWALGRLGAREAIADLQRTLREDKGEFARWGAAFALGLLGAREAIADLQRTLREDRGEEARAAAAFALGLLGAREAIADLQRTLREDKGEEARAEAASALGALLGAREAIAHLRRVLQEDGSESVREAAAEALWRIADSPEA